jgi:hypothetical protein
MTSKSINKSASVGSICYNVHGNEFTVIERVSRIKRIIKFSRTGFTVEVYSTSIRTGQVADRLEPSVCGVGCLGYANKMDNLVAYAKWSNMLRRCYDPNDKHYDIYGEAGVKVCERWFRFDLFLADLSKLDGYDTEKFLTGKLQLDKDKKQFEQENKVYSLETCCLISNKENCFYREYSIQKEFIAISPDGEIVYGKNIHEFCREHDLHVPNVANCLSKRIHYNTHKGWRFEYLNESVN